MRGQSFMSPSSSGGCSTTLRVLRRQAGDGALQIADRREMLVQRDADRPWPSAGLSSATSSRTASSMLFLRSTQPASLHAEQPVEQSVRDHLRRQRRDRGRPSSCCAGCSRRTIPARRRSAASGSATVVADLRGDHLVDRRAARAAAGERRRRTPAPLIDL